MRPSGSDTRLNSALIGMVATRSIQDVKAQLMLFCTIYINYDHKPLAGVKKPAIAWDKFKRLASKRGPKFAQEEKVERNEVLVVCICFETKRPVVMMITNSGICL